MKEIAEGVLIHKDLNPIYALSFMYYLPVGACLGILVGLIASLLTGGNSLKTLDPELITPLLRRYLPKHTEKLKNDYRGESRIKDKLYDQDNFS